MKHLVIQTDRLLLNQPQEMDIPLLLEIMKNPIYNKNTTNIPFPYTEGSARFWIELAEQGLEQKTAYIFAIRLKDQPHIIGGIGLGLNKVNNNAELGYWLNESHWNKGYVTEAAQALLSFGFNELNLKRIFASYFSFNEASGRIMEKIGMKKEGLLKAYTYKNGEYIDHVLYASINPNNEHIN